MANLIDDTKVMAGRRAVVISVMVAVGLIHAFRVGSYLSGKWYILYSSFFGDVVIPFSLYFMLCMFDINLKFLRAWYTKALIIFAIATATEIAQWFGIYMLGVTFDPLDIVMFAVGVLLAAFIDVVALSRATRFWAIDP